MSKCKKCKKTKCCCVESNCATSCLGCTQEFSSECVYLAEELGCLDLPKGTDLTKVFESFCTEIETIQEDIETLQEDLDTLEETVENLSASDISVTGLNCFNESEVSEVTETLQNVLEDICAALTDLQDGIVDPDSDWFKVGTTTPPSLITDNMFHMGNVGIGLIAPTTALQVTGDVLAEFDDKELFIGENRILDMSTHHITIYDYDFFLGLSATNNYTSGVLGLKDYLRVGVDFDSGESSSIVFDNGGANPLMNLTTTDNGVNTTSFVILKNAITIDGTTGFTGTVNNPTTITVRKGIVTNVA